MLDEPSLGLSPGFIKNVFEKICEINRETGAAILLVEQKVQEALAISTRVYSLKLGRVAYDGPADELRNHNGLLGDVVEFVELL
jgi:branched-chain amino acid transport system ATP-binding protein